MKKVLVTGANGHLGYTLTKMLSEKEYAVRAGVREFKEEKLVHLKEIPNVEIVKCDILNKSEFEKAADGVNGMFHVAAVYKHGLKNPDESILRPAIEGTINALNIAKKNNIKIILTSSCVAVGRAQSKDKPLNENSWESSSKIPYHIGKTKAEQLAWEFSKNNNIDLTVINPVAIIGPYFYSNTPSTIPFTNTVNKKLSAIPPVDMCVVDVRDVALAHIAAFENSNAKGRYLFGGQDYSFEELVELMNKLDPTIKIPKRKLSRRMFILYARFLSLGSKISRKPPQFTVQFAKEYTLGAMSYDSSRIQKELHIKPRPLEETLRDMISWIRTNKIKS